MVLRSQSPLGHLGDYVLSTSLMDLDVRKYTIEDGTRLTAKYYLEWYHHTTVSSHNHTHTYPILGLTQLAHQWSKMLTYPSSSLSSNLTGTAFAGAK